MPRRPSNSLDRTGSDWILIGNRYTPIFNLRNRRGKVVDRFMVMRQGKRLKTVSTATGKGSFIKFRRSK